MLRPVQKFVRIHPPAPSSARIHPERLRSPRNSKPRSRKSAPYLSECCRANAGQQGVLRLRVHCTQDNIIPTRVTINSDPPKGVRGRGSLRPRKTGRLFAVLADITVVRHSVHTCARSLVCPSGKKRNLLQVARRGTMPVKVQVQRDILRLSPTRIPAILPRRRHANRDMSWRRGLI